MPLDKSAEPGADIFDLVAATEEFKRGTWVFVEKNRPAYTGR